MDSTSEIKSAIDRVDREIDHTFARLRLAEVIVNQLLEVNDKMSRTLKELNKLLELDK